MECFVGFSHIFLLGILIFKGITARCLYKSFGVKGLDLCIRNVMFFIVQIRTVQSTPSISVVKQVS
jgi:hypothetical protein